MSDIVIHAEGLSKQYRIGPRQPYLALREVLTDRLYAPFRRLNSLIRRAPTEFGRKKQTAEKWIWALNDVSLDVKHGEILGIIGRNGAGKSTLLKILSRITRPTVGRAEIFGRIGSLLEVGTGFHPELSGRENIYLNGAVLGLKKTEINRKFDEIISFAEIEKFLDTPVKRYSSGMYVRLAFAVGAHLEQEILIIDEVLAVGDASFQKKCLNKMEDVRQEGRTVLFVSHNMQAISRLCKRAILFDEGRVIKDGLSHEVVSQYLDFKKGTNAERKWSDPYKAPRGEIVRLDAVRVKSEQGHVIDVVDIRHPFRIEMEYEVLKPGYKLMPHFQFRNEEGADIFSVHDLDPVWRQRERPKGRFVSVVFIPGNLLSEGMIFVDAGINAVDPQAYQFHERDVLAFKVIDNLNGDSARGDYEGHMTGVVRPMLKWSTQFDPD